MRKYLFLLGFLFGLAGCTHLFLERGPSSQNSISQPRHIVISVHGIAGDAMTWGKMGSVLSEHLRQINPHYSYEFYNFSYPTGEGKKNTFDFGHEDLGNFIKNIIFGNGHADIQPEDRITFVTHSQGGLVATIWYIDTLVALHSGDPELEKLAVFTKYAKNVDTIITLGTPFWGSKIATRLSDEDKFDFASLAGLNDPRELEDMSFGSNTIYKFRRTAIAISQKPLLQNLIQARMVNIAGIFPKDRKKLFYPRSNDSQFDFFVTKTILNWARHFVIKLGFGSDRYESDFAVLAPSSRVDFLYAAEASQSSEARLLTGKDFQWADLFSGNLKRIVTESVHTPVSMKYNVGMAVIPADCLNPDSCVHPTYRHILQEVARCEINLCDQNKAKEIFAKLLVASGEDESERQRLQENLQGFTVDVVLRIPKIKDKDGNLADYDIEDVRFKDSPGLKFSTFETQNNSTEIPKLEMVQKYFFEKAIDFFVDKNQKVRGLSPLVDVYFGRKSEYLSKQVVWEEISHNGKTHRDLRLTLTGVILPSVQGLRQPEAYQELIKAGIEIPMGFRLPGLIPRKVGIKVLPGVSSYLELKMAPINSN